MYQPKTYVELHLTQEDRPGSNLGVYDPWFTIRVATTRHGGLSTRCGPSFNSSRIISINR